MEVYKNALAADLRVYELSKKFPHEEKYSLTDQIRRSSRSVCANIAEAWRKRRYEAAFISKLSDAEGEAAEIGGDAGSGCWPSTAGGRRADDEDRGDFRLKI